MKQLSQIYLLLLLVTMLNGCSTIGYYSQAVSGHLSLIMAGEPVEKILANNENPLELRGKLSLTQQARHFAAQRLALTLDPDGPVPDEKERHRKRGLTIGRQQADGMSRISGYLTPEARACWDALAAKLAAPGTPHSDNQSPGNSDPADTAAGTETETDQDCEPKLTGQSPCRTGMTNCFE